jgi:hypothetical protein
MIPSTDSKTVNTRASRKATKKMTTPESRESSEQPENGTGTNDSTMNRAPGHAGNITHPRRAAQNRAAQRTFRNRRKAYIKELEQKVQDIDRTRELMASIHHENQQVWHRLQALESLASQNGIQIPTFAPLTPFVATGNEFGQLLDVSSGQHDMSAMMNHQMGSSGNEDEEDEDDMSDSHQLQHIQHL